MFTIEGTVLMLVLTADTGILPLRARKEAHKVSLQGAWPKGSQGVFQQAAQGTRSWTTNKQLTADHMDA